MSLFCFVRHGQATVEGGEYDILSELGVEQAEVLGRHLAGRRPFDAVYTGPRRRQRDTAAHLRARCSEAGVPQPEAVVLEELDEFVLDGLWYAAVAELAAEVPNLLDALRGSARRPVADAYREPLRRYQDVVERGMRAWMDGGLAIERVEAYAAFRARVDAALARITAEHPSGRRVLVVTSAGTVSQVARVALGLSAKRTIDLVWSLANASVTELRASPGRLTLTCLNSVGHLPEELVTLR